jgi:hypothetical protein
MAPINVKYCPAIKDRTVERLNSYEEGWEAVLYENKEEHASRPDPSDAQSPEELVENCEAKEVFDLIEKRQWHDFVERINSSPETTRTALSGGATVFSSVSSGNLVLHEVCNNEPPLEVVEKLIAANKLAVKAKGNWGYLPLHYACTCGASAPVIKLLLDTFPEGARMIDCNDHMLPLHLASKWGSSEEVFMTLLAAYPEATLVKDDFGRTPMEYARSIHSDIIREVAIASLERGEWLCATSKASRQMMEAEYELRIEELQESHSKQISGLNTAHADEKSGFEATLKVHEVIEGGLLARTEQQETKIGALESALEIQTRDHEAKLEAEKELVVKTEVALGVKTAELNEMALRLDEAEKNNDVLAEQLCQKMMDFEIALEEIGRLSNRVERLDSLMTSIRHLTNTGSPMKDMEVRDAAPAGDDSKVRDFQAKARRLGQEARSRKDDKKVSSEFELVLPSKSKHIVHPVLSNRSRDEVGANICTEMGHIPAPKAEE